MRTDLILLAFCGFVIAMTGCFISGNFWIGLSASVLAGAGKELIWDRWLKKGTPDKDDFFATAWGGLAGAVMWLMIVNVI